MPVLLVLCGPDTAAAPTFGVVLSADGVGEPTYVGDNPQLDINDTGSPLQRVRVALPTGLGVMSSTGYDTVDEAVAAGDHALSSPPFTRAESALDDLAALGEAYDAWVAANADVTADGKNKDFGVWNVEMGATPEDQAQFVQTARQITEPAVQ